jgi:predicted peroxiredoxin
VRLATLLEKQRVPLAGNSGQSESVNVTLFLTLQGPRLVDSAQPQDLAFGSVPGTLEDVTIEFLEEGGKLYVCPLCGKEIGLTAEDLLYADDYPGQVKIADEMTDKDISRTFLCADKVLDF